MSRLLRLEPSSNTSLLSGEGAMTTIGRADFARPFEVGLEYSSPARGPWNIVHLGMLVPESHQVFVCAQSCLRGVVLTAAELGALDRFSTVAVEERNVMEGTLEDQIVEGTIEIVKRLPQRPRALLVFTNCLHHFTGCDVKMAFERLRAALPDIDVAECYMAPILRQRASPDVRMRIQIYTLLAPRQPLDPKAVNVIGNIQSLASSGEVVQALGAAGWTVRQINDCRTYDQFQIMARSAWNLTTNPVSQRAGQELSARLGQRHLHLPYGYESSEIRQALETLREAFDLQFPNFDELEARAAQALDQAARLAGDRPVAIDYTATLRPLSLARVLLQHGFNVRRIYADSFIDTERSAFEALAAKVPDLELCATVHPKMAFLPRGADASDREFLAIGQKAAYFTDTRHFVNVLEGGGLYGFRGLESLADMIARALSTEADMPRIVQVKGWGCQP